jgi:carboxybiotin decarboxylase
MKNIIQLLFVLAALFSATLVQGQEKDVRETIISGKWVNRSDGYVANPTYNPNETLQGEEPSTTSRFKTFNFIANNTFTLDSAKQRYTGRFRIQDNNIILEFNPVVVTHLRRNMNPNTSSTDYVTEQATVVLSARTLYLSSAGELTGDGFIYQNYSSAVSGIMNFYEFSGFANVSWKHLMMMLVGLFLYSLPSDMNLSRCF